MYWFIFFFNDTATTEIYTLSLHDALPISERNLVERVALLREASRRGHRVLVAVSEKLGASREARSEEHTSELQSRQYLVCRLLLEKKNKHNTMILYYHYKDYNLSPEPPSF